MTARLESAPLPADPVHPASSMLRIRRPSSAPATVRRRRLDADLDRTHGSALTLVSAGPGFGKTMAVSSWVDQRRATHAFAWLTVDPGDNSAQTFWSDVLAAIRSSGAVPAGSALDDISPATVFGAREVDLMLDRFDALDRPLVLILDDFHLITSPDVLAAVAALVEHRPRRLRLVIMTRADPVLPLHRLRITGRLTEIRGRHLAFTPGEAARLLAAEGLELASDQLADLYRRTDGWPAGLRLAAMSLDRTDLAGSIERLTGTDRVIAEYLLEEVVERLDPADREFLLRTSVVDRLCADLADRLTGGDDGQQVIDRLVASNAFVTPLDDANRWVAYHPLLRDLVRHRLMLERSALVPGLNRRVAAWLAEQGEPIASIRYAIRAQDWADAGRTLLTCAPRILSADASALAAAVEPMASRSASHPGLYELIAANIVHLQRQEFTALHHNTLDSRQYLDTAPPDLRSTATALLDLFDIAHCRMTGDSGRLIRLCRDIRATVRDTPRAHLPLARHIEGMASTNLGVGQLWTGDEPGAEESLADAERHLTEPDMELPRLGVVAYRSVLDAMVGRYGRAERQARPGLDLVDRRGWASEAQVLGLSLAMGMTLTARGRADQATAVLGRGLAVSTWQTDRLVRLGLAISSVEAAVLRADGAAALAADARVQDGLARTPAPPDPVRRWAAAAGAAALITAGRPEQAIDRLGDPGDEHNFATAWQRVWLARAHLELHQLARVEEILRPFVELPWRHREPMVTAQLLLAVVADRHHRPGAAANHLATAVELAHPEAIRRPFLLLADRLGHLVRQYRPADDRSGSFISPFAALAPGGAGPVAAPVEDLTERELTVLRYLPTMLKAGEIGADLHISVSTVKTHMRSIYRKLEVGNRRQAVERARILSLL
ncbi:LuxR C-terminal-related transcriptional regulator [Nakamurella sp.]|uniref:LuxR C-terminal-related transcriptional regulator n=1 Tax=Nakamurella sp. TaxID=1869182 RepID=UPI003B3B3D10